MVCTFTDGLSADLLLHPVLVLWYGFMSMSPIWRESLTVSQSVSRDEFRVSRDEKQSQQTLLSASSFFDVRC